MDTFMLEQASKEIRRLKEDNEKLLNEKTELLQCIEELLHDYTTTDFDFIGLNPNLIEKCKLAINKAKAL